MGRWVRYHRDHGGRLDRLTVSPDAYTPGGTAAKLHAGFVACVREWGFTVAEALPPFRANAAHVLALESKGCLREGADADVLVVERETLAVTHVWGGGQALVQAGRLVTVAEEN